MNDKDTAERIARGDQDCAERFVRETYPAVFRLLRHLTGQREDAEDLTQQTFLTARQQISNFRGKSSLFTWTHRIAFNEYLQWKRRKKRTLPLDPALAAVEKGYGSCIAGESLLAALGTLPDKMREAFVLHEIEELSMTEAAEILKVPVGTVKARVFYARKRLRPLFENGTEVPNHEPKEVCF